MNPQTFYFTLGLILLIPNTSAFAAPASTEFVRTAIDGLRSELSEACRTQFTRLEGQTQSALDALQTQVNALPLVTYQLGEVTQGGLVFYVDASHQHGLMVSLDDTGQPLPWRNGEAGDRLVNAKASGFGAGRNNTQSIVAQQTIDWREGHFAAQAAAQYQIAADGRSACTNDTQATPSCFGGWFLPSLAELTLLHHQLTTLGLTATGLYWSSTEANATQAWGVDMANGTPVLLEKSTAASVRAIHSF